MFVDCIIIHDHPIDGTHWWYIIFSPYMILSLYDINYIYICYHLYIYDIWIYMIYIHIYIYSYLFISIHIYIYYIGFPSHLSWHRRVTAGSATLLSSLRSVAATCSNVTSVGSCNSSARRQVWWEKCGKNMGSLPWEIGISNGISWDYDGIRLRWINTCKVVLSWNRSHRVDDG